MNRSLLIGLYSLATAFAWLALGWLVASGDAERLGVTSGTGLLTCLLLVSAPGATFIPLARWIRVPFCEVEGMLGWGALVFMLAFLEPSNPPTLTQFLLFLLTLTVALATAATFVSYLVGVRVYRDQAIRHDVVRARRQGYLASFTLIAIALLHSVGTLSPATGTLLVAVAVLAEMFALARVRVLAPNRRSSHASPRAR